MKDILEFVLKFFLVLLIDLAGIACLAFPVTWAWNLVMPDTFGLTRLTWTSAVGLQIVIHLLKPRESSLKEGSE